MQCSLGALPDAQPPPPAVFTVAGTAQTDTEFYFCKGVVLMALAPVVPVAAVSPGAGDDFQAPDEISFDQHSSILQRDA